MKEPKRITILHVDDDEANRYTVRSILERADYRVIEAPTGREGILLTEKEKPDLIILDIRLPDIDGYMVSRILRSKPETTSIPILQTSATFTSSENKVEGLESGADGYLAQPIDNAVLVATIRSLLRTRQAEKAARDAKRGQEEILAIVSHDLRNPLSVIMLQTKLMKKALEKGMDATAMNSHLDRVQRSVERMNKLIEDLLDVANIEEGKLNPRKEKFFVEDILDEVTHAFEDLAGQQHIRLRQSNGKRKGIQVYADRHRIIQALSNLVSNALRFTSPEGSITIGAEETEAAIIFHVADTGAGIPEENLPHIFNRFWQGHKDKGTGVGLGLSIVKGIVEAHNGSVWAESQLGKGTTFSFMLPK